MDRYETAWDYIRTQPDYNEIMDEINSKTRQINAEIDEEFIADLKVRKKKEFYIPEFPRGWESIFESCLYKIEHSMEFVNDQIMNCNNNVFPENENLFNAFRVPPNKVKVIIIGQDPYHSRDKNTGRCVSNGMAFSCVGSQIQPSLRNIFKEIERTHGQKPTTGDLTFWADQGVLLLNSCLTVNEGEAGSHRTAWVPVIKGILEEFFERGHKAIVCLWGVKAREFFSKVTYTKKNAIILTAGHPSGMNTTNPFVGCGHFKEIDEIFDDSNKRKINWISPC